MNTKLERPVTESLRSIRYHSGDLQASRNPVFPFQLFYNCLYRQREKILDTQLADTLQYCFPRNICAISVVTLTKLGTEDGNIDGQFDIRALVRLRELSIK